MDGKLVYEATRDGANVYNEKGEVINTFHCFTCDGEAFGTTASFISYDKELNLFNTSMGYISLDLKTAYFED